MTVERWGPRVALLITIGVFVMGVAGLALKEELVRADLAGIPFFAFGVMGAFVAAKQPRNPIGWLFMLVGTMPVVGFFSSAYATRAIFLDPGSLPAPELFSWMSSWAWIPGVATLLTFCLVLYPTGRLPSRRWTFLPYGATAALIGAIAGIAFMPGKMEPFEEGGPRVDNPFGIQGAEEVLAPIGEICLMALLLFGALSVVSLVFRFRAAGPRERQQIKWFLYPAALLIVLVLGEIPIEATIGEGISDVLFSVAILLLPVGTGIGVLRYRLFDIDVVINRTLVYLSLTALLIGSYLAVVVVLQRLLAGIAADSDLAVAASTLTVAALFRPLRARVQRFIDHRFYRRRYDARRTLEGFSGRLRDEVDLDQLTVDLVDVVAETMQPRHASVWLRPRSAS